jgi:hypothetical protein
MTWERDCEEIRQTISLYCQLLDDQRYDELLTLFTEDAMFYWNGNWARGRDAMRAELPTTQLPRGQSRHLPYGPVIRLDGDSATVWTDIVVTVHLPDERAFIGWAGRYHQRFVRRSDRWLIREHVSPGIGDPLPDGVEPVDARAIGS